MRGSVFEGCKICGTRVPGHDSASPDYPASSDEPATDVRGRR